MIIDFRGLFERHNIHCTGMLHIGASSGQEREIYAELNIPEVLWIEAIPNVFDKLKENLIPYPNQTAIKCCLGDVDGEKVVFHVSNNEGQSSSYLELGVHATLHPEVHYVEDLPMKTIRLDSLFLMLERDIKHINFLNIDVQGAELKVLKGAGNILNQIDYIYAEVNAAETYIGCPLISDLDEFLSDFERVETSELVGGVWGDALYIRKINGNNE